MTLDGYKPDVVSPFETVSGSVAIVTASNGTVGTATAQLDFPLGTYDLAVNYYDMYDGKLQWQIDLNGHQVGEWLGNSEEVLSLTPCIHLNGHSPTRMKFRGVKGKNGDALKIVDTPSGVEPASLDYIAAFPSGVVD